MSSVIVFSPESSGWLQKHPKLGVDLMQHLFDKLCAKYPRLWMQSFQSQSVIKAWKEVWAESFEREGISPVDVNFGLGRLSKLYPDFPPTEGQFILACRPVMDAESAFSEAVEQMRLRLEAMETGVQKDRWSHPAIYWAAVKIGTFDLRNAPWSSIKGRWTAALQAEYQKGKWADIPAPALALPAPGQSVPSKEVAAERAAMLKQVLNGGAIKRMEEVQ